MIKKCSNRLLRIRIAIVRGQRGVATGFLPSSKLSAIVALSLTVAAATSGWAAQPEQPPTFDGKNVYEQIDPGPDLSGLEAITRQATARLNSANDTPELRGSGPSTAMMEVDFSFPDATIYRPVDLAAFGKSRLGLMIWGNGGCSNDGASARAHLAEVASHGYLVIAAGKPLTGPANLSVAVSPQPMTTTVNDLRSALNWALAENESPGSPYFEKIDPDAIAVAGHSCGGMQAILLGVDPRIQTVLIHNSGINPGGSVIPDNSPLVLHEERLKGLRKPVLLLLGGPDEVMWKAGLNTFERMPEAPAVFVSSNVGHEGTFADPHGGAAAQIAVNWLEWQLRNDRNAMRSFVGANCTLCNDPEWTIRKKNVP